MELKKAVLKTLVEYYVLPGHGGLLCSTAVQNRVKIQEKRVNKNRI